MKLQADTARSERHPRSVSIPATQTTCQKRANHDENPTSGCTFGGVLPGIHKIATGLSQIYPELKVRSTRSKGPLQGATTFQYQYQKPTNKLPEASNPRQEPKKRMHFWRRVDGGYVKVRQDYPMKGAYQHVGILRRFRSYWSGAAWATENCATPFAPPRPDR